MSASNVHTGGERCRSCGDPLKGADRWRTDGTCAWCQPGDVATCPQCWGSGTRYTSAADIDGDDCMVCIGTGEVVTRAGKARRKGRAA